MNYKNTQKKQRAFTLIELLIVVAIIAILAAIAVPNFLEAQTRSKVARVQADMRSLVMALETYYVDNNDYIVSWHRADRDNVPLPFNFDVNNDLFTRWRCTGLTTPISYMTVLPETPFQADFYLHSGNPIPITKNPGFEYDEEVEGYYNGQGAVLAGAVPGVTRYHLRDTGPDYTYNNTTSATDKTSNQMPYDPTNGTVSVGDIWRFGP